MTSHNIKINVNDIIMILSLIEGTSEGRNGKVLPPALFQGESFAVQVSCGFTFAHVRSRCHSFTRFSRSTLFVFSVSGPHQPEGHDDRHHEDEDHQDDREDVGEGHAVIIASRDVNDNVTGSG